MAIGSLRRFIPAGYRRVERRSKRRAVRAAVARTVAWGAGVLALGWLVAAGLYGLVGGSP